MNIKRLAARAGFALTIALIGTAGSVLLRDLIEAHPYGAGLTAQLAMVTALIFAGGWWCDRIVDWWARWASRKASPWTTSTFDDEPPF